MIIGKFFQIIFAALTISISSSVQTFANETNEILSRFRAIVAASETNQLSTRVAIREAITKCHGKFKSVRAEEIAYKLFLDTLDVTSRGLSRQEVHSLLDKKLAETVGPAANNWPKGVAEEVLQFIKAMNSGKTSIMCVVNESSRRL